MADTNVSCVWNSGVLEFRQGIAGASTGTLLFKIDASASVNGFSGQLGVAAVARTNTSNLNANYSIVLVDNTGATYYIAASGGTW